MFVRLMLGLLLSVSLAAKAAYPVKIQDAAGRTVVIESAPQRVVMQDSRDVLLLSLLMKDEAFTKIVAWHNVLKNSMPDIWQVVLKQYPAAANINNFQGAPNTMPFESLVAEHPDLLIMQYRWKSALSEAQLALLEKAGIKVVFIDATESAIKGALHSVDVLGQIFNKPQPAQAYISFYQKRYDALMHEVQKQTTHPTVFLDVKAGLAGVGACCFTHANYGWGFLVKQLGLVNLGESILQTPYGDISPEYLLKNQPDVLVMTGANWSSDNPAILNFGYGADEQTLRKKMHNRSSQIVFSQLKAIQDHRLMGINHMYYSSPFNLVALEALAKAAWPSLNVDPNATYNTIMTNYVGLPNQANIQVLYQ